MSDRPIYEYLQDAAQLIEDTGWCRGFYEVVRPGRVYAFCLVGAVRAVTGVPGAGTARRVLKEVAEQLASEGVHQLPMVWNDEEGRTAEEVTGLLWRTADRLKAQEEERLGDGDE